MGTITPQLFSNVVLPNPYPLLEGLSTIYPQAQGRGPSVGSFVIWITM